MKILSDVESTLEYIKELRKSTYSNILTSGNGFFEKDYSVCLLYTSPSPRD